MKSLSWMDKTERKKKAMALEEAFVDHYTPGRKDIAKASTWFGLKKYLPSIWK